MSNKYFEGIVENKEVVGEFDQELIKTVTDTIEKVQLKMDDLKVSDAIKEIFQLFKRCNKYIDETMPWVLAKEEDKKDRLATVLYNLVNSIQIGASLLESFMPETSEKILKQINAEKIPYDQLNQFGQYKSGMQVTQTPEILFARLDVEEIKKTVEKLFPITEQVEEEKMEEEKGMDIEAKDEISYDDFMKLQFQVGKVISCEEVPKSKKLLCSQIQVGSKTMQIVSGIKAYYSAEEMLGKKVMVLVNLQPVKLAGVLSEGMILCAENEQGELAIMVPEKELPAGAEIA